MARSVKSPNTFKTCYIAAVKEEMGLLRRKLKPVRRIKPPAHLRWAIEEALRRKPNGTYREIQELALEIYNRGRAENLPFFGALGEVDEESLNEVLNDKGLAYED
jgi:hypothetical protein